MSYQCKNCCSAPKIELVHPTAESQRCLWYWPQSHSRIIFNTKQNQDVPVVLATVTLTNYLSARPKSTTYLPTKHGPVASNILSRAKCDYHSQIGSTAKVATIAILVLCQNAALFIHTRHLHHFRNVLITESFTPLAMCQNDYHSHVPM